MKPTPIEVAMLTATLADEVVNQRVYIGVYATAEGERKGSMGLTVHIDRDRAEDIPFVPSNGSFKGWNGSGLTNDERRYAIALLYNAAMALIDPEVDDAE